MASIQTINFSQYQWEVNDQDYLTKWNNFQSAINNLQENINQFGADAKQEIDGAISYVDAIRESYRVNLMDAYSDHITLGADFRAGRYTRDDGIRLDTNNLSDLLTFSRSAPKRLFSPSCKLTAYLPDQAARQWIEGVSSGVLLEYESTNKQLNCNDLTSAGFSATGLNYLVTNDYLDLESLIPWQSFIENNADSTHQIERITDYAFADFGCVSVIVEPVGEERQFGIEFFSATIGGKINRFVLSGSGSVDRGDSAFTGISHLGGNRYLVYAADDFMGVSTRYRLRVHKDDGASSYLGDGESGFRIASYQSEPGRCPTSRIRTTDAAVTRPADSMTGSYSDEFNLSEYTVFISARFSTESTPLGSREGVIGFRSSQFNSLGITRDQSSTRPQLRFGDGTRISSLQSISDNAFKAAYSFKRGDTVPFVVNGLAAEQELTVPEGFTGIFTEYGVGRDPELLASPARSLEVYDFFVIPRKLTITEMQELTAL